MFYFLVNKVPQKKWDKRGAMPGTALAKAVPPGSAPLTESKEIIN